METDRSIVRVKSSCSDKEYSWDLLSDDNLKRMCIYRDEIIRVESFIHIPGGLYTEREFRDVHPVAGSVGYQVYIEQLNNPLSIQIIFSYDYGHRCFLIDILRADSFLMHCRRNHMDKLSYFI